MVNMWCCVLSVSTHSKNLVDTCIYMYTHNRHTIPYIKTIHSLFPNEQGGRERREEKGKGERLELQKLHSKVNIIVQIIFGGGSAPINQKVGRRGALAPLAPSYATPVSRYSMCWLQITVVILE